MKKYAQKITGTLLTGAILFLTTVGFAQTTPAVGNQVADGIRPLHVEIPEAALTNLAMIVRLTPNEATAQQSGIMRTELQRHDLSAAGYEAVQVRVDFEPGTAFGLHTHPGEEIINVLEGSLEYVIEGEKPVVLKAGEVLFIPAGKYHSAKNVGKVKASELATYIVQKGKPILLLKVETPSSKAKN
ncbi:quercetin dioxygenase-like cupin family protein [Mucilaginibacter sp. UYP25]|uniref:cupin domain-containing protein n=1 Tax=unclassified Mucilaginibacter TaxID=2617802 RepID=UPI0033969155